MSERSKSLAYIRSDWITLLVGKVASDEGVPGRDSKSAESCDGNAVTPHGFMSYE